MENFGINFIIKLSSIAMLGVILSGCNVFDVSQGENLPSSNDNNSSATPEGIIVTNPGNTDSVDNPTTGSDDSETVAQPETQQPIQSPGNSSDINDSAPINNGILANPNSPLGTNLAAPADWSTALPFTNIMRSARSFKSSHSSGDATFDENGWITSINGSAQFSALIWDVESGSYPTGDYVVLYDGEAELSYSGATVVQKTAGREVVHVSGTSNFGLFVQSTNPNNYFRNARVILPGGVCESNIFSKVSSSNDCSQGDYLSFEQNYHDKLFFNPDFLHSLLPYSTLRFMDFMDTNLSEISDWSQRNTFDSQTWGYGNGGVAVEAIVRLCNQMQSDCWINVPTKANDQYVTELATYFRDNLNPDLKLYVEYSNEVWNYGFKQTHYAKEQGLARGYGWVQWCSSCARTKVDHVALVQYYAARSVEIFTLFEQVFGGTSRLDRVLAVQNDYIGMSDQTMAFENAFDHADSMAIAPYFGGSYGNGKELDVDSGSVSVTQLFNHLESIDMLKTESKLKENLGLAVKYNTRLIAYEGGQHLVGVGERVNNDYHNALYNDANHHARMKGLYQQYLQIWKDTTVDNKKAELFVHFTHMASDSKWGRWGTMQSYDDTEAEAPKQAGIMEFVNQNTKWW